MIWFFYSFSLLSFSVRNSNLFFKKHTLKSYLGFSFFFFVLSVFWIFCECVFFPPFLCFVCVCASVCARYQVTAVISKRKKQRQRREKERKEEIFFTWDNFCVCDRIKQKTKRKTSQKNVHSIFSPPYDYIVRNNPQTTTTVCDGVSWISFSTSLLLPFASFEWIKRSTQNIILIILYI